MQLCLFGLCVSEINRWRIVPCHVLEDLNGQTMVNQNPEQIARDQIDALLSASGWRVQDKNRINLSDGQGQAVREYPTDTGPAE